MSSLDTNERQVLEKLFQMGSGYVLNFSDRTFGEFFKNDLGINIYDPKFNYASGSKANRMRGFWQESDDAQVGTSIERILSYIETQILLSRLNRADYSEQLTRRAQEIAARLLRKESQQTANTEDEFIAKQFGQLPIDKLKLDPAITAVLRQRLDEIRKCLTARAPLAVIFHCGSSLEGILLGIACLRPKEFNQSKLAPKDASQQVKRFQDWTLSDFINVSRDLNLIGEDVKKFSHSMRDFRNYIHPYQQWLSRFDPDDHTARICWQVLQAAIIQLSR